MHKFYPNLAADQQNAAENIVPRRSEIAADAKWRLSDIYKDRQAFEAAYASAKESLPNFAIFNGKLADPAVLAACLELRDSISIQVSALFAYARMHRDTDNASSDYQALTTRTTSLLSEAAAAQSFIEPELLALEPEKLLEALEITPALAKYKFFIANLLRQKKHILSPAEEQLLAQASEICQAPANIFTILTNADLKFPKTLSESGELTALTEGRYNQLIRSSKRPVRQAAFQNLFHTYASFRNSFATAYSSQVQSAIFQARARKYPSTLAAALAESNIPLSVYDNVISTVRGHLAPLHRYVALKKKALQLPDIHMYDLYTPLTPELSRKFSYQEGLALIRKALQPLGPDYLTDLNVGAKNGWIDIYENKGKRNGAYSWGVYGVHPFVLLNYDRHYNAVSTLAHELGHAMHSFYSNKNQEYVNSSYTIFCAEVASTTNENLLLDYMLTHAETGQERLYFLNQYLEQVRSTVYRQVLFAEFEKIAHAKAERQEALTADALEKIWLELNRDYYGEDILLDDEIKIEWARIPHFYRPFYVYQYATGYAAATALADGLQHSGERAQQAYRQYLQSGGSDYSLPLLQKAGVDMATAQPLEITLQKFASRLNEFEELLHQLPKTGK